MCDSGELENTQSSVLQIQVKDYLRIKHLKKYISKLSKPEKNDSYEYFRSLPAKLKWCTNYRPQICCVLEFLVQNQWWIIWWKKQEFIIYIDKKMWISLCCFQMGTLPRLQLKCTVMRLFLELGSTFKTGILYSASRKDQIMSTDFWISNKSKHVTRLGLGI